jgi:NAD(P)-dependent dehydrogenase (short-subunit alcohol dehydrogenase family)
MVQACLKEYGALDILHNNAYWAPLNRPLADTTEEEWDRTIDVTLKGVFLGCKYAIPEMIARGGGVIINTASTSGLTGSPAFAAYMAAKGGVIQLTRSVALDYGPYGIRCNAIAPGIIETPATRDILAEPQRRQQLLGRCLVGRIGQPEDVARAALYLASDDSSFMTGHVLVLDGGRMNT